MFTWDIESWAFCQCMRCLPEKELGTLPMHKMFTCLRCFYQERERESWALCQWLRWLSVWDNASPRDLCALQVFKMLTSLRFLPVSNIYLRESWALCQCLRCWRQVPALLWDWTPQSSCCSKSVKKYIKLKVKTCRRWQVKWNNLKLNQDGSNLQIQCKV